AERKGIEYIKQELNFHIGSKCYLQNRCIGFNEIPLTHSLDDAYIIMDIVVDITEGLFRLRISKGIEEFFNNDFEDVLLEDVVLNINERISYIRKCNNEFPKIND